MSTTATNDLTLNLDPLAWEDACDDDSALPLHRSRLHYHGGVTINGVQFHVTALQVYNKLASPYAVDFQTTADDKWVKEDMAALDQLRPEGPWQTLRIGGLDYVVYLIPYAS